MFFSVIGPLLSVGNACCAVMEKGISRIWKIFATLSSEEFILFVFSYTESCRCSIKSKFVGIIAKLIDVPYVTSKFPVFDDIMGRFGIWVWEAAIISILFLNFFPKSQMVLWSSIAIITPFCGFMIWQIHREHHCVNFISSLPFMIFFTEWYLTAFTGQYWTFSTAKDKLLLGIAYLCFTSSLSAVIPTNKKRLFSLFYGILESIILILLIRAGIIFNPYDLLNV